MRLYLCPQNIIGSGNMRVDSVDSIGHLSLERHRSVEGGGAQKQSD